MSTYMWAFLGSVYLALLTTPLVIHLARRIGAVDYPGVRRVHRQLIPRIGGVSIYISAMCMIVALLFLDNRIGEWFRDMQLRVITLLGCATGVFLIGLIDDLRGVPARIKFLVESLGAVALCLVGVRIGSIGFGEGHAIDLGWMSCPITLLWIVGVTNAVNMSDGLDGLAVGVAAIACGTIAVFAIHGSTVHTDAARANDVMMALFALTLLGALSGFLFFNFNPAKVFIGDCGTLFVGFTIAAASVMCVSKSTAFVGLALPALALGIPIFDTLFCMLRRFLERRSIFAPDRSHFHHRLLEMGLRQRHVVLIIYAITLLAAGLGVCMMVSNNIVSLAILAGALLMLVILFRFVGVFRLDETFARLKEKYSHSRKEQNERRLFEELQLQFRQARDSGPWWAAVCEAAQKMDFAWIALRTTYEDGRIEEELWRQPNAKTDLSRIITMTIPLIRSQVGVAQQMEIAIHVGGGLESAARRASQFGRLLGDWEGYLQTAMQSQESELRAFQQWSGEFCQNIKQRGTAPRENVR
jgi:UDP-GlcNAc:undecaprenyl-phosphate GlcNAc-1-phosphate transferase